jgi:hypothetical protein
MASLSREHRRELERVVIKAREVAESGARKALESLGVHHHEPWPNMNPESRKLRNRLRAHGRQLGDWFDQQRGTQSLEHLVQESAYEHWHRMLFARFLAECDLLIEPNMGIAISFAECRELAMERSVDWLTLATEFAVRMLPQIFREDDPVLEVALPPETRLALEELLKSLANEVFVFEDSLGWVYQFWQAEKREAINSSGEKVGADEVAPVTQLFTEDYMVRFLLHNTIGAWWAGKFLASHPDIARSADSEEQIRNLCSVGNTKWNYLRFTRDNNGRWNPAAGTFEQWPQQTKDLKLLDPCMGSGHFLVFALPILCSLRMVEEGLAKNDAIAKVLSENLFGLEIDPRCTQIAAFNLALAAWRVIGYRQLPVLNLACSGLGIHAREDAWLMLTGDDRMRDGMQRLYSLFRQAPTLGSLIDPRALGGDLLVADFEELKDEIAKAFKRETNGDAEELTVTAQGVARAAEILSSRFTLIATNVPYLGRGKQEDDLKNYCASAYPEAKADLSTCFVERCLNFCDGGGTVAIVTPQNWFFLGTYKNLRQRLFLNVRWSLVVKLGPAAFQNMNFWAAKTALCILSKNAVPENAVITGFDVSQTRDPSVKAALLRTSPPSCVAQAGQLRNPDARLLLSEMDNLPLLDKYGAAFQGIATADYSRFGRCFWELPCRTALWEFQQSTVQTTDLFSGREHIFFWENGNGSLAISDQARVQGLEAVGQIGIAVSQMNRLPVTLFTGEFFDNNCSALVVRETSNWPAIWTYCSSDQFLADVREIDQAIKVTNASLVKVPFDLEYWKKKAAEKYPQGLPKPASRDPTQWLFNGHPKGSNHHLQVAVARVLGYAWPRQTGSSFPECPALGPDGLEEFGDSDGIVSLDALHGELPLADRIRSLLAKSFGDDWAPSKQSEFLKQVGSHTIEDWLRDKYFSQHCDLFHQRPFIWHICDGLKNGFNVLVNYHKLAAPNGEGRRTLEKLIYTYLGEWIDLRRADQKRGVEGAELRIAAAEHLKEQLERILDGEPPYDIFVRWKPLHEQPMGWEPDINDGVRINIRPFMVARPLNAKSKNASLLRVIPNIKWDKDRGKEPLQSKEDFPWFWSWDQQTQDFDGGKAFDGNRWNNLHYTRAIKEKARRKNDS